MAMPNTRECSGGIVLRQKRGELRVLMVKSTRNKKWTFPKGGMEPELSATENAVKEIFEEAGVVVCPDQMVGRYDYVKDGTLQMVYLFLMRPVLQVDDYPEALIRRRKWMRIDAACASLCDTQSALLQRAVNSYENPFGAAL
ncbi:NUDIX hydrolase [Achromobacter phage Motura]|uniref:NUDIX hydrolase n=1 Tax=Achromobacter phage Motura TaxID=2591403 RepID=A0A514CSP4_9CAUD|nr:nudix hydrolase [Achromobacter phage Motura]QDH83484.1 NUDIX hydrolase [Achromobacter phage Motura]